MREWIENRLGIRDEILQELKAEVSEMKSEVTSLLSAASRR